jgi:hypothetical protein
MSLHARTPHTEHPGTQACTYMHACTSSHATLDCEHYAHGTHSDVTRINSDAYLWLAQVYAQTALLPEHVLECTSMCTPTRSCVFLPLLHEPDQFTCTRSALVPGIAQIHENRRITHLPWCFGCWRWRHQWLLVGPMRCDVRHASWLMHARGSFSPC